MKIKSKLLSGALTISVGAFVAKVLGAFYRIPLTNIIGTESLGLYQMIFPLYCILLTISSTGIPNSLSKLISEGNNAKGVLTTSLKTFSVLGAFGSLIMLALGYPIAFLQGDFRAGLGYILLSPSVLIVSVLSCYRGYFQGSGNMKPTALSQVIEQLVKLSFGLLLGYIFRRNVVLSSSSCALAVTISEVVATFIIYLQYKRVKLEDTPSQPFSKKNILRVVFPITISSMLIPLARVLDRFLILNILKRYLSNYTQVYGIYSGGVESIINVPVVLCYGFAITGIPFISSSKAREQDMVLSKCKQVYFFTALSSSIFAILLFFGSDIIVKLLYFKLSLQNKTLMAGLIKTLSITVISLSLLQTTSAILVSLGKLYSPCINLSIGVLLKVVFSLIFLFNKNLNIYASAISDIICFTTAFLLNSFKIFKKQNF
ncbi:MAG: oligosaccharide flippase family protein [Clostridia bacterium]|nr:oligosaccharide flippase family protein [Clostridia bacterium]